MTVSFSTPGYIAMSQQFVERYLGVHTADAEGVELAFADNILRVRFVDWQELARELVLPDTVAFRWQEYDHDGAPRDDVTYEVVGSTWLAAQLPPADFPLSKQLRHYKLCFNACGSLDVICGVVEADRN